MKIKDFRYRLGHFFWGIIFLLITIGLIYLAWMTKNYIISYFAGFTIYCGVGGTFEAIRGMEKANVTWPNNFIIYKSDYDNPNFEECGIYEEVE